MEVRHETDGSRNDEKIFDDVLSFKSRDKRCLPCGIGKKKEWKRGREHMKEKKRKCNTFCFWNKKKNTDDAFKRCKEKIKRIKVDE